MLCVLSFVTFLFVVVLASLTPAFPFFFFSFSQKKKKQIYNEIVNDLLNPANTNLKIREDVKKGVFVEGLKEDVVMTADQVFSLLHAGTSHRHIGRTNFNDVSRWFCFFETFFFF